MKTQNTNLLFNKSSLVELNDAELQDVKAGTCTTISTTITLTISILLR
ncbi:class I lanthipeptide [Lacinutrix sp.]|nr:class I lanthipeptide [Lacinutrix sp.]